MKAYTVTVYYDDQMGDLDEKHTFVVIASSIEDAAIAVCKRVKLKVENLEEADSDKACDYQIEQSGFKYEIWITNNDKVLIGD